MTSSSYPRRSLRGGRPSFGCRGDSGWTWVVGWNRQVVQVDRGSYVNLTWFNEPDDVGWFEARARELIHAAAGPLVEVKSVEEAFEYVRTHSLKTEEGYHTPVFEGDALYIVGRGVGRVCIQEGAGHTSWTAMGLTEPEEVYGFRIEGEHPSRFDREEVL